MPVYPCARCGSSIDPTVDLYCRNCSDKQPYECSRCNKRMSSQDIFQLEKLKTKKPLLCMSCGESGEVVKCKICKLHLVRSTGRTLSSNLGAPVYHSACVDKQLKTVGYIQRITPFVALLGLLVGFLVGQTWGGIAYEIVWSILMAAALAGATWALAYWQTPK